MEKLLANIPGFLGVFDDLSIPKVDGDKRQGLIFGIHAVPKGQSGSAKHWTALFYSPEEGSFYFDPYGAPPSQEVERLMKKLPGPDYYSNVWVQPLESVACGWFCVGFIRQMFSGMKPEEFLYSFDPNASEKNNDLAKQYALN